MPRTFLRELGDGDSIDEILLVRDKQVRTNRNGNLYLQMELEDKSGSLSARYWNATEGETRLFETGDFLRVKGKVQIFQGQQQLIVSSFETRSSTEIDLVDFIPEGAQDVEDLLQRLRGSLDRVRPLPLQAIARAFLMDAELMGQFSRAPAGIRHHHAYLGGLLEHVVNLLEVWDRIADLYPDVDPDLMRLGIFLHDLGKVRELTYARGFAYGDEGQLLGHLVIGVEMLTEKIPVAADLLGEPIDLEIVLRLKHLIVSHHGQYEFGSPKLPMTPEAIALHHLDNLDAKVHNFVRTIKDDQNVGSSWTNFESALGRKLFKGSASVREALRTSDRTSDRTSVR